MHGARTGNKLSLEDALEREESCVTVTGRKKKSNNNRNTIMIILKCATVTGRKKKSNKNRNTIMIILKWWQCYFSCSGTFSNLRKANISFVMLACPSVSPSVRMEQLGSHWKDFHEILYLSILQKSVKEIQVPLKSDKHNGYFT